MSGVQWPALKCDGTDSLGSYPQTLRPRLIAITTKLDAAKAKRKAEEEAKKLRAEQERLDAIRVTVTITAAFLSFWVAVNQLAQLNGPNVICK